MEVPLALAYLTTHCIETTVSYFQRCIGLRFLYPVYCIPEVELTKSSDTSITTVDKCKNFNLIVCLTVHMKIIYKSLQLGLNLIEKCGKTAFFRSGPEPLILNDEERYERRKQRAEFFKKNRIISSRGHVLLPNLAHTGNYAPVQDDSTGDDFLNFY
jgi:hypothetical protein